MSDKWYESLIPEDETVVAKLDTGVPHNARIYNYWLGGKDNISQEVPVTPVSASSVPV